jgi:trimeric autotransporter adhesin
LYIAGRFRSVGNLEARGLAFYDGISWQAVGKGSQVSGGLIFAMATLHGDLYVGGSLSKIGNTTVSRFAKWDGRSWSPIGSFNGDVHSIATDGESVLVGGDFTQVEDVTVRNIARYYSGRWVGVGGGLDGTVLSIRSHGSCLYVGGTFTSSFSADGQEMRPAKYLTRRCVSDDGEEAQFETFEAFDTLGPVHVIQPFF